MSFMDAVKTCFSKYVTFSGRAARSEFWWFVLFLWIATFVLSYTDTLVFGAREVVMMSGTDAYQNGLNFSMAWQPQPITGIFMLATFLPNLAVSVRRLHDTNRSGWWILIGLIPLIGLIVLLVFFVSKGTDGDNDHGADPLA